jgi:prevent-host-death family protein
MARPKQPDESLSIVEARNLGPVVDRVRLQGKHIELTRNGKPAAIVVPVEWWLAVAAPVVQADAPESTTEGTDHDQH